VGVARAEVVVGQAAISQIHHTTSINNLFIQLPQNIFCMSECINSPQRILLKDLIAQRLIETRQIVGGNSRYLFPDMTDEERIEYRKQTRKLYYLRNKEKIDAYQKEYRELHRGIKCESAKKYVETHKEKVNEYQKEYRRTHRKERNESQKQYASTHKEQINAYRRNQRKLRKEKENAIQ